MDLQDVFQRFTFDTMSILIFGIDLGCLYIEFPEVPITKAVNDAAIFFRGVVAQCFWNSQRWLGIEKEKKLSKACETRDRFIGQCISKNRQQLKNERSKSKEEEEERRIWIY